VYFNKRKGLMVLDYAAVYRQSSAPVGLAAAVIMAWMARVDNEVTKEEHSTWMEFARQFVASQAEGELVMKVFGDNDIQPIEMGCRIMKDRATEDQKTVLIDLLIGVMLADHYVLDSERYVLDFVADLIGWTTLRLNDRFREHTGRNLPPVNDFSDPEWWKRMYNSQNRADASGNGNGQTDQKRKKAFATLGLDEGATMDEIKAAYRRLAQIHHPDRFHNLGEGAVKTATETFRRIKEAYEVLTA
jgi:DnaJ-domain-containing protein 1